MKTEILCATSTPIKNIFIIIHFSEFAYIHYAHFKFCFIRSINEGTLHEELCTFPPTSRLPAEEFS